MSNLDLISGEVVEDSDNRDAVTILAKNTLLLLPIDLHLMNKHQLEAYLHKMLIIEYEKKWGKKKSMVKLTIEKVNKVYIHAY